jgi:hypothetical protein
MSDDARVLAAFTAGRQVPTSLTELNKVHLPAARRDAALARLVERGVLRRNVESVHRWNRRRQIVSYTLVERSES